MISAACLLVKMLQKELPQPFVNPRTRVTSPPPKLPHTLCKAHLCTDPSPGNYISQWRIELKFSRITNFFSHRITKSNLLFPSQFSYSITKNSPTLVNEESNLYQSTKFWTKAKTSLLCHNNKVSGPLMVAFSNRTATFECCVIRWG